MAEANETEAVWMVLGARGSGGVRLPPKTRQDVPAGMARRLYRSKKAVPYNGQDGGAAEPAPREEEPEEEPEEEAPAEEDQEAHELPAPLPDDFPYADILADQGIDSLEKARSVKDWDEVEGIGQAREKKIVAYLKALED